MNRFRRFLPLVAVLVGAVLLWAPTQADAAFKVRYSTKGVGGPFTVVDDNGAGDLDSANAGSIIVNIAGVGTVTVNSSATASMSKSITLMDLSLNGSGISGKIDLVVQATLTDVNSAPPPLQLVYDFTGSVGAGAKGVTKTIQTTIDDANGAFAMTGGGIVANTTALTVPASGTISGFTATDPYSVTTSIHVSTTGSTLKYNLSFDSNNTITASPAPVGLVLALTAVPALGLGTWFRCRRRMPIAS